MVSQGFRLCLLLASILLLTAPLTSTNINSCFSREVNYGINSNFSKGVSKFGLNFFRKLVAAQEAGESLVVSPFSVWSALCLTFFGSRGVTRSELTRVLRLSSKTTTFTNWRALQERSGRREDHYLSLRPELAGILPKTCWQGEMESWVGN